MFFYEMLVDKLNMNILILNKSTGHHKQNGQHKIIIYASYRAVI